MTTSVQAPEFMVSPAGTTVEAGQALEVTVGFVADRPTEVVGGRVELVRHGAVAHFERGWMGAGATVSFRRSAVLDRADLDPAGPLVAGQHLVRQVTLTVPAGEATVDGYLVQREDAVCGRLHLPHGCDAESSTAVLVTSRAADRRWVTDAVVVVDDAVRAEGGLPAPEGSRSDRSAPAAAAPGPGRGARRRGRRRPEPARRPPAVARHRRWPRSRGR
jgi:hypothetical protein